MSEQAVREPVLSTEIPGLKKFISGKVRDVYDLGETLLLVASDRISAFDVIMPNGIPDKGRVLTQMARFWFRTLRPIAVTHYISCDDDFITAAITAAGGELTPELKRRLSGRATLGVKANAFPVECVVRGYIAGSLWKEYCEAGGREKTIKLHGYEFPGGLRESDKLPTPIFTPATKAASGHDENISTARAAEIVGAEIAAELERTSIALYSAANALAASRGIILADTKFEFGLRNGALTLIDEALTPDSSRYWAVDDYEPGKSQASFDKQFVRDWLVSTGWKKEPPAPVLPPEVVAGTRAKYMEAFERITGLTELS